MLHYIRQNVWNFHSYCLSLQCVFHSIRFKVNKVGVQRYSFFLCLEAKCVQAFFSLIGGFMKLNHRAVIAYGDIE